MDINRKLFNSTTIQHLPGEILEKIFDNLNIEQVANCRLVSRNWAEIATTVFKKKINNCIFPLQTVQDSTKFNLSKYLNYLENENGIPFGNIALIYYNLENELIQKFLNTFGNTIKGLALFPNVEQLPNIEIANNAQAVRRILLEQCTNLEKFSVGNTSPSHLITYLMCNIDPSLSNGLLEEEERQNLKCHSTLKIKTNIKEIYFTMTGVTKCFNDLLLISPKLEILHGNEVDTLNLLETINASKRDWKIRELKLNVQSEEINNMLNCIGDKVKLESLNLWYALLDENLLKFLKSQSKTLKRLKFYYIQEPAGNTEIELPEIFPKLTEFELNYKPNNEDFANSYLLKPGNFCKRFPSLKKLTNAGKRINIESLFELDEERHTKLIKLQLPSNMSPDLVCKFGEIFPNLKYLDVNEQCVQVIHGCIMLWPKLEMFCFQPNFEDDFEVLETEYEIYKNKELRMDALITGFTSERQMKLAEKSEIQPILPSITNLKCLKRLIVGGNDFKITEYSVNLVLSKLNLELVYFPYQTYVNLPNHLRLKIGLPISNN